MRPRPNIQNEIEARKKRTYNLKILFMSDLLKMLSGSHYDWKQNKDAFEYCTESGEEFKKLFETLKLNFIMLGINTKYPFISCRESMTIIAVDTNLFANSLDSSKLSKLSKLSKFINNIAIINYHSTTLDHPFNKGDEKISKIKINVIHHILKAFGDTTYWKVDDNEYKYKDSSLDRLQNIFQSIKEKFIALGIKCDNQSISCNELDQTITVNIATLNEYITDSMLLKIKNLIKLYYLLKVVEEDESNNPDECFCFCTKKGNYTQAINEIDSYFRNKNLITLCLFNIKNMIKDGRLNQEEINSAKLPANLVNVIQKSI